MNSVYIQAHSELPICHLEVYNHEVSETMAL